MRPGDVKRDWSKLSPNDADGWKLFFDKYCCLTVADIAGLVGVSQRTVRKRRQLLPGRSSKPFPAPYVRPRTILIAPPDWDNREWLLRTYEHYGVRVIARAVGKTPHCISMKLAKYGIATKNRYRSDPPNVCDSRDWLLENYHGRALTVSECAKRAMVSRDTIVSWLLKHEVPLKHDLLASMGEVAGL